MLQIKKINKTTNHSTVHILIESIYCSLKPRLAVPKGQGSSVRMFKRHRCKGRKLTQRLHERLVYVLYTQGAATCKLNPTAGR